MHHSWLLTLVFCHWSRYLDLWPCSEPERAHFERLLSPPSSDPTAALLDALPAVPLEARRNSAPLLSHLPCKGCNFLGNERSCNITCHAKFLRKAA